MTAQSVLPSILAWVIALAFLWSIILYLLAIFVRERRQEAGLLYTFGGAILYIVLFSDRLRIAAAGIRTPLEYLPGVSVQDAHFNSSIIALIILGFLYFLRVLVFYRLIAKPPVLNENQPQTSAARETINDIIAPSLAFYSLTVCLVALVHGCYHLNLPETLAVAVALLLLYYLPILSYIIEQLQAVADVLALLALRLWKYAKKIPIFVIVLLVSLEAFRRRGPAHSSALGQWALDRLNKLDRDIEDSAIREEAMLTRLAQRLLSGSSTQADSEENSGT